MSTNDIIQGDLPIDDYIKIEDFYNESNNPKHSILDYVVCIVGANGSGKTRWFSKLFKSDEHYKGFTRIYYNPILHREELFPDNKKENPCNKIINSYTTKSNSDKIKEDEESFRNYQKLIYLKYNSDDYFQEGIDNIRISITPKRLSTHDYLGNKIPDDLRKINLICFDTCKFNPLKTLLFLAHYQKKHSLKEAVEYVKKVTGKYKIFSDSLLLSLSEFQNFKGYDLLNEFNVTKASDMPFTIEFKNLLEEKFLFSTGEDLQLYSMGALKLFVRNELQSGIKNILLVLDEIDLGFHPQWQKSLFSRFVSTFYKFQQDLIKDKVISNPNDIHIACYMSTHSPYIISDMPKNNVKYIDNNGFLSSESFETFGNSIQGILNQEMFNGDKGLTGEFAKKQISGVIDILRSENPTKNELKKARSIINLIDERFVHDKLYKEATKQ